MKTRSISTRISAILLACATSACGPTRSAAADPPPRPAAPPAPPAPTQVPSDDERRAADLAAEPLVPEISKTPPGGARGGSSRGATDPLRLDYKLGKFDSAISKSVASSSADTPALLVTDAMDATVQAEWTEDLKVMDKLLRDQIGSVGGDDPNVMGIPLTLLGRAAPMYLEGGGAVFRIGVNWPLAHADKGAGNKDEKPRDPASAWEKAKRELNGSGYGWGGSGKPGRAAPPPPEFSQEKVDALIADILRVLPEATNMRHLKPTEFVFVTVSGSDDRGAPVRLTMKVRKSDIDDAASGKIKPEEFKQRVPRRIG